MNQLMHHRFCERNISEQEWSESFIILQNVLHFHTSTCTWSEQNAWKKDAREKNFNRMKECDTPTLKRCSAGRISAAYLSFWWDEEINNSFGMPGIHGLLKYGQDIALFMLIFERKWEEEVIEERDSGVNQCQEPREARDHLTRHKKHGPYSQGPQSY